MSTLVVIGCIVLAILVIVFLIRFGFSLLGFIIEVLASLGGDDSDGGGFGGGSSGGGGSNDSW